VIGVSTLLAVLALAGAPASTPVTCNPSLDEALGITYWEGAEPQRIELGPTACAALLYAAASPRERKEIRALNGRADLAKTLGVGLQVALHEANHVALKTHDECRVEKVTRTEINGLIRRFATSREAGSAEVWATASDAALPPSYHDC
jgi:hypothetical protein